MIISILPRHPKTCLLRATPEPIGLAGLVTATGRGTASSNAQKVRGPGPHSHHVLAFRTRYGRLTRVKGNNQSTFCCTSSVVTPRPNKHSVTDIDTHTCVRVCVHRNSHAWLLTQVAHPNAPLQDFCVSTRFYCEFCHFGSMAAGHMKWGESGDRAFACTCTREMTR